MRNPIQVITLLSSKEQSQHRKSFQLGKQATLKHVLLPLEEMKKVQIIFDGHELVFSCNSADLNFLAKPKHQIQLNADLKLFRRAEAESHEKKQGLV